MLADLYFRCLTGKYSQKIKIEKDRYHGDPGQPGEHLGSGRQEHNQSAIFEPTRQGSNNTKLNANKFEETVTIFELFT